MGYAMISFQFVLIFAGILFLFLSLVPIRKLILELQDDELKQRWKILSTLILFFIVCYILFAYNLWMIKDIAHALSIVVSLMLLCGGIFCYLVGKLALRTMHDIQRLSMFQEESITDALMGIKNRCYFDQKIVEEVALSLRYKLPLSLILLDIDHFKKINDTYGHDIGDYVLRELTKELSPIIRESDYFARIGGEEFVILLINISKDELEIFNEKVRKLVEKISLKTSTNEEVKFTISIGSTIYIKNESFTSFLKRADIAMYKAKELGKNRVVSIFNIND